MEEVRNELALVQNELALAQNGESSGIREMILATDNTRLAATLRVFGAQLKRLCPLEWVDIHKSRESFVRYLEDREKCKNDPSRPPNPEVQPKPKVTFNFDGETLPRCGIVKAFDTDLEKLDADLEFLLAELPFELRNQVRDSVTRLIARACHEVLLKREELVRELKRVPNNAKFDHISHGNRIVRLGKNASPELRSHFLSKLPA
jgi:hypothetical protein